MGYNNKKCKEEKHCRIQKNLERLLLANVFLSVCLNQCCLTYQNKSFMMCMYNSTYCGLVTPYGIRNLDKSESNNERPWLNWNCKWILIREMVKKIWAAVTEFSQETENLHRCLDTMGSAHDLSLVRHCWEQCWFVVNETLTYQIQWILNQNEKKTWKCHLQNGGLFRTWCFNILRLDQNFVTNIFKCNFWNENV